MFPIMKLFDTKSIGYTYIHTGQHYDDKLFLKFIEEFGIRTPDYSITFEEINPVDQVSIILKKVGSILNNIQPSLLLAEGDTNSVLASALAALKSKIPIAHVESGLRSNDWRTVEEHNRRIVDHVSDVLFSPTEISSKNLRDERVYGEIHTVGNTVIDAINLCLENEYDSNSHYFQSSNSNNIFTAHAIDPSTAHDFVLVTMHRSENVDDINNLKNVLIALTDSKLNYVFPMHPHTVNRTNEFGLSKHIGSNIKIIEPLGYLDFLFFLKECKFVITDSGGIQEEITSPKINKRAIVLRESTERPESVESGHSVLCNIDHKDILNQIQVYNDTKSNLTNSTKSPYGDGNSADQIVKILEKEYLK